MTKPQKIFNIWILSTLFLFYFGPLEYDCNKILAVGYIILFLIIANFMYYLGTHVKIRVPRKRLKKNYDFIIKNSIYFSFFITLALLLEAFVKYGFKSFSITSIISQMANTYSFQDDYVFMISAWILSYTKWIRIIALVLGSYYWGKIGIIQKIMYIVMCAIIVVYNTLYAGSQKELIDLAIYILIPIICRWIKQSKRLSPWKIILIIVAFCTGVVFLGSVINSRHQLWQSMFNSSKSTGANYSNWIYKLLPSSVAESITYLLSYLTQGYRGLALCLTLPFKWSFGMGSSFKLMNDVSRWFSIPLSVLETSYPVRMEAQYGIGAYSYWNTIFPWIASDFTFIGAIFVVGIFIYYWAKAWREFIKIGSWISIVMFTHLSILVLYIPCNNQLFQTRDSIVASLAIFILWYFFHGRIAENNQKGDLINEKNIE